MINGQRCKYIGEKIVKKDDKEVIEIYYKSIETNKEFKFVVEEV